MICVECIMQNHHFCKSSNFFNFYFFSGKFSGCVRKKRRGFWRRLAAATPRRSLGALVVVWALRFRAKGRLTASMYICIYKRIFPFPLFLCMCVERRSLYQTFFISLYLFSFPSVGVERKSLHKIFSVLHRGRRGR